mmetsp:Transcript_53880/g.127204  ORF Transcript_53880/g.127204 Transcript_53880/m.127204 type:complete len:232 (-) Transcript_53880:1341-2036(-)
MASVVTSSSLAALLGRRSTAISASPSTTAGTSATPPSLSLWPVPPTCVVVVGSVLCGRTSVSTLDVSRASFRKGPRASSAKLRSCTSMADVNLARLRPFIRTVGAPNARSPRSTRTASALLPSAPHRVRSWVTGASWRCRAPSSDATNNGDWFKGGMCINPCATRGIGTGATRPALRDGVSTSNALRASRARIAAASTAASVSCSNVSVVRTEMASTVFDAPRNRAPRFAT